MNIEEIYHPPYGVELHGPDRCGQYLIAVDGYEVPYIVVYKRDDTDTDWTVTLDDRFEVDVDDAELRRFAPLLFNAMAVAAGMSAGGENCQKLNLFKRTISTMN